MLLFGCFGFGVLGFFDRTLRSREGTVLSRTVE